MVMEGPQDTGSAPSPADWCIVKEAAVKFYTFLFFYSFNDVAVKKFQDKKQKPKTFWLKDKYLQNTKR